MFAGADHPDAVFVANDHMAFAAMDVLRFEIGLRIPDDVSVIGFDDVPPAAWRAYDLTTVRQEASAMVAETVGMLRANIEDPGTPPRSVCLPAVLITRSSARKPEGWLS